MSDVTIILLFFSLSLVTLLFNSTPVKIRKVKDIKTMQKIIPRDYPFEKKYRLRGYKGYYGVDFYNEEHNKKLRQADILIDVYNTKINTFNTEEENNKFAEEINEDIEKILKGDDK